MKRKIVLKYFKQIPNKMFINQNAVISLLGPPKKLFTILIIYKKVQILS
jgi:hypothetical protein